ncbi:MAG: Rpn family recombination-promoting nuclease/putative transposase [Oscillospiraceae bacterium]|nr:Rpn family recombination-promoting nuclease/putative transposase [Oscillospiraceae bacterium]
MNLQVYDENFIMSPKIDFAFKEIMANPKALKGFLSAVLNIPPESIKNTTLKNTNLRKTHEHEKQGILDVRLVMNNDKEIDIEIQLSYMAAWADRSVFYIAKMMTEQAEINKKYSNFKKCIGINILDFNYINQTENFHTVWHIREDNENIKYTDILEWHVVELPKIPSITDGTDLYKWVQFIKAEKKEEFEMIAQGNEYLESALDTLNIISQDEQKRLEYTARQKTLYDYNTLMEENYDKGLALGLAKGRTEGKAEMEFELIKKWKAKGMTDEQIKELLN